MERTDYDLLSIDEVARTIGQSAKNLRRMIDAGEFPDGFPAPKQKRWQWQTVRDWVIRRRLLAEVETQSRDKQGHLGTNAGQGGNDPSQVTKRR